MSVFYWVLRVTEFILDVLVLYLWFNIGVSYQRQVDAKAQGNQRVLDRESHRTKIYLIVSVLAVLGRGLLVGYRLHSATEKSTQ